MLKVILVVAVAFLQVQNGLGQQAPVPPTMTSLELWNPFSWYYPFAIASANAWGQYFNQAQAAHNLLYQHVQNAAFGGQSTLKPQGPPAPPTMPPMVSPPPVTVPTPPPNVPSPATQKPTEKPAQPPQDKPEDKPQDKPEEQPPKDKPEEKPEEQV